MPLVLGIEDIEIAENLVNARHDDTFLIFISSEDQAQDFEFLNEPLVDGDPITIEKAIPGSVPISQDGLEWGIIAVHDDMIVGASRIMERTSEHYSLCIEAMYVEPSHRGEGLGRAMAHAAIRVFENRAARLPESERALCEIGGEPVSDRGADICVTLIAATEKMRTPESPEP